MLLTEVISSSEIILDIKEKGAVFGHILRFKLVVIQIFQMCVFLSVVLTVVFSFLIVFKKYLNTLTL